MDSGNDKGDCASGPGFGFTVVDHGADLGLVIRGRDRAELFAMGAEALFSLITDLAGVGTSSVKTVSIETGDPASDDTLVVFLNELLYLWDTERFIPRTASVSMEDGFLRARLEGEEFDAAIHSIRREVKAVTYHQFAVAEEDGWLHATVVVDV
jgi:SHS2 domain-containing protein